MTDLDLDAINSWCGLSAYCDWVAATDDARSEPCDVHRVVAALREARAEVERTRASLGSMVEWLSEVIVDTRDALRVGGCTEHFLTAEQAGALEAATRRERNADPSRYDLAIRERDDARAAIARVRALALSYRLGHVGHGRTDFSVGKHDLAGQILAALNVRDHPSATTDPQSASVSPEEALTVRCGTCDADPGEACVTVGPWPGRVQRYPHESRYGKAREARPSATTDGGAG